MKKQLIYLSIILSIFIITGCSCNNKNKEKIKENDTNNIIQNKHDEVYKSFKNKDITYQIMSLTTAEKNNSTIIIQITNNLNKKYELEPFTIQLLDKNNKIIYQERVDSTEVADELSSVYVDLSTQTNLTTATQVKYIFE